MLKIDKIKIEKKIIYGKYIFYNFNKKFYKIKIY